MIKYSFCESIHAYSRTKWCIRPLSEKGRKLCGGIDSSSLCGHVTPQKNGWDLTTPINPVALSQACPKCVELYKQIMKIKGK
jgi:hypothetical protein